MLWFRTFEGTGPFTFAEETVRSGPYLNMLKIVFFTKTATGKQHSYGFDIEGLIFQQDGAPPHYHLDVRNELNTRLLRRWIGRVVREDLECLHWPPRSPDLTRDLFLWGFIKQQVYQPPLPPTIED
ncbi:hypothetical protein ANN_14222 [Periplaneta americana]|uniref:Uncharacterized protein n=1 Tax=Periplaneta americana TaxID=6978 RepID=A0ABQ8SVQ2_PERAM|nr:hypothetical protein ANN_14222 [Periplaneta americana]